MQKMRVDGVNQYFTSTKPFLNSSKLNSSTILSVFDFAYKMTFGSQGEHRKYRSGGTHQRKLGEIFADTFQGKLSEFAIYNTLDKLPYYIKKVKEDSKYFKDIGEILIQMYSQDNQVFLAIDKAILCAEYLSEKYLIVFTEKQYVADRYKNKEKEFGARDAFALFYELNEKNLCKGMILNPFTETQTIFTKDSLDSLHLELMFDVPWKKKK